MMLELETPEGKTVSVNTDLVMAILPTTIIGTSSLLFQGVSFNVKGTVGVLQAAFNGVKETRQ